MKKTCLLFITFSLLFHSVSRDSLAFPGIPEGYPAPAPILYAQGDWRNGDWASPHYYHSFYNSEGVLIVYTGHPEWGPTGVADGISWRRYAGRDQWEGGSKEVYERFLSTASGQSIYLRDGRVVSKPVILHVNMTLISGCSNWEHGWCDLTPQWVYRECGIGEMFHGRLVGHILCQNYDSANPDVCQNPQSYPAYENACWLEKMEASIREIGARYDSDERLSAVMIPFGFDGEIMPVKSGEHYDASFEAQVGGRSYYRNYVKNMVRWFREAFPRKPLYVQGSWADGDGSDVGLIAHSLHPHGWSPGEGESDYYYPPVGYKINAMTSDGESQFGWSPQPFPPENRNELPYLGGWWKIIWGHYDLAPTALEAGKDMNFSYQTFAYLAGLATHVGWMDTYKEWFDNVAYVRDGFVSDHLGKTIENTPDVWVALRDTVDRKPADWYTSGKYGDFEYWLYRVEDTRTYPGASDSNTRDYTDGGNTYNVDLEGSKTVVIGDAPFESRQAYFGNYDSWDGPAESLVTRRTDQAHGQNYMAFIVDADYPPKENGWVGWKVSVRYFDQGSDQFWIDYTGLNSQMKQSFKITKSNQQVWKTADFFLTDAKFDNVLLQDMVGGGLYGIDFRLNAGNDGDEIIHMVKATSGLDLSGEVVEFTCWQGSCSVSSGAAEVEIRNLQSGSVGWRAVAETPWLSVSKASGVAEFGNPDRLTITVDPAGLEESPFYRDKSTGQETEERIPYQAHVGIHSEDSFYPIYRPITVRLVIAQEAVPDYITAAGWNQVQGVAGPISESISRFWRHCLTFSQRNAGVWGSFVRGFGGADFTALGAEPLAVKCIK